MRTIYALMLAVVISSCEGATAAKWWENFQNNPAAQAEVILGQVDAVERVATIAFGQLKGFLPADQQATYQAKFDVAVIALSKAVVAAQAAIKTAADAKQDTMDISLVISDVTTALKDVQAVVAEVKKLVVKPMLNMGSSPVKAPIDTTGADALDSMVTAIK